MFFSRSDADFRRDNAEESPKFPRGPGSSSRREPEPEVSASDPSRKDCIPLPVKGLAQAASAALDG